MNTFHINTEQVYKIDQNIDIENKRLFASKFKGIAIKLSVLKKYSISIGEILNQFDGTVIVDAEFDRLDTWLNNIDIDDKELNRIIFTVQAKSNTAEEQLLYFHDRNLKILLVAGHNAYLNDEEQTKIASDEIIRFLNIYHIHMLGIGSKLKTIIEKKSGKTLSVSTILELQGYQTMQNSGIWTYLSLDQLSVEAKSYLNRRLQSRNKNTTTYLTRDYDHLFRLCKMHFVYVFIDITNKKEFFRNLTRIKKLAAANS